MIPKPSDDDIVISGMSGRLPFSDDLDHFASNLYSGIDMVTEDDSRYPIGKFLITFATLIINVTKCEHFRIMEHPNENCKSQNI